YFSYLLTHCPFAPISPVPIPLGAHPCFPYYNTPLCPELPCAIRPLRPKHTGPPFRERRAGAGFGDPMLSVLLDARLPKIVVKSRPFKTLLTLDADIDELTSTNS